MFRISKKDNEISLYDIPFDAIFPSFISSVMLFLIARSVFSLENISAIAISLFLLAAMIISLIFLSLNTITTIKFNERKKSITVQERSLIKNVTKIYSFREVTDFIRVYETEDFKGRKIYKMSMSLEAGEKIELLTTRMFQYGKYTKAADVINHMIFDTSFDRRL